MAKTKVSTYVPVSTAQDIRQLSAIKQRSIGDLLRELTYEFLKKNAARLAQIKIDGTKFPKPELGVTMTAQLPSEMLEDLRTLAQADDTTVSQVLCAETEKYVEANRALLNNA